VRLLFEAAGSQARSAPEWRMSWAAVEMLGVEGLSTLSEGAACRELHYKQDALARQRSPGRALRAGCPRRLVA
jgi:hypothetical protein